MSYLPTAPSRSSPSTFATLADAFLAALPGFGNVMEALAIAATAGSFQGAYAGGTTYALGQTVASSGIFYVSLQASNTGHTPASSPTYWYAPLGAFAPLAAPTFSGLATFVTSRGAAPNAAAASAMDCSLGQIFTKTAVGALTWTATNVPASGLFVIFLELTNGGLGTQTWMSGTKWDSATAPTLSSSGKDILRFYTTDGGTTWNGAKINAAVA